MSDQRLDRTGIVQQEAEPGAEGASKRRGFVHQLRGLSYEQQLAAVAPPPLRRAAPMPAAEAASDGAPVQLMADAVQMAKPPQGATVLQTGGNTISNATARALAPDKPKRDVGRALEELKADEGLGNDHHGKIWSDGSYTDENDEVLGNILSYLD